MQLLKDLNIKTNNINLYQQALTHSSYANEENTKDYERLEYLGDAVLELVISEYIYNKSDEDEGTMTKVRASYVCEDALYEYSVFLNLNEYLKLGKGEIESGGKYRKAIVADIFEGFIGAMFLDKGFNQTKNFIYKYIIKYIEDNKLNFYGDYKSTLQELVQTDRKSLEYILKREEGPAHNKLFTVVVKIDDIVYGTGIAHSKKEAEQIAAKDALNKCISHNSNFKKNK